MPSVIRRFAFAVVVAFLLGPAGFAGVRGDIRKSLPVGEGGRLDLQTNFGSIDIRSGGSGVQVVVEREARTMDSESAAKTFAHMTTTIEQRQNDVVVRMRYDNAFSFFGWFDQPRVHFVITVPRRYNVSAQTSGGSISIADLTGEVSCHTSGGSLRIGHIEGPVDASTSGGSVAVAGAAGRLKVQTSGGGIQIDGCRGPAEIETSGGSIHAAHVAGDLVAHTSGGGIHLSDISGSIDASTSGGSVTAELRGAPRADSRLETSGGGIHVSLAPNVGVYLDAAATGGGVSSELPVTVIGKQERSHLAGKINGGGPRLVLRTSGGSVHVTAF
jgi:hypothetical protein